MRFLSRYEDSDDNVLPLPEDDFPPHEIDDDYDGEVSSAAQSSHQQAVPAPDGEEFEFSDVANISSSSLAPDSIAATVDQQTAADEDFARELEAAETREVAQREAEDALLARELANQLESEPPLSAAAREDAIVPLLNKSDDDMGSPLRNRNMKRCPRCHQAVLSHKLCGHLRLHNLPPIRSTDHSLDECMDADSDLDGPTGELSKREAEVSPDPSPDELSDSAVPDLLEEPLSRKSFSKDSPVIAASEPEEDNSPVPMQGVEPSNSSDRVKQEPEEQQAFSGNEEQASPAALSMPSLRKRPRPDDSSDPSVVLSSPSSNRLIQLPCLACGGSGVVNRIAIDLDADEDDDANDEGSGSQDDCAKCSGMGYKEMARTEVEAHWVCQSCTFANVVTLAACNMLVYCALCKAAKSYKSSSVTLKPKADDKVAKLPKPEMGSSSKRPKVSASSSSSSSASLSRAVSISSTNSSSLGAALSEAYLCSSPSSSSSTGHPTKHTQAEKEPSAADIPAPSSVERVSLSRSASSPSTLTRSPSASSQNSSCASHGSRTPPFLEKMDVPLSVLSASAASATSDVDKPGGDDVDCLKGQLKASEAEIAKLTAINHRHDSTMALMKRQREELTKECERLRTTHKETTATIFALELKCEKAAETTRNWQRMWETSEKEKNEVIQQRDAARQQRQNISNQLAAAQRAAAVPASCSHELELITLRAQKERLTRTNQELSESLESITEEKNTVSESLREMRADIDAHSRLIIQLRRQLAESKSRQSAASLREASVTSQLQEKEAEKKTELARMAAEHDLVTELLRKELAAKRSDWTAAVQRERTAVSNLSAALAREQTAVQDLTNLRISHTTLSSSVKTLKATNQELSNSLRATQVALQLPSGCAVSQALWSSQTA